MKLQKVISGGQTGADIAGLRAAKISGLETGGWIPRGFRTETGSNPSLATFGLKETPTDGYQLRTLYNVRDSDATFWFGRSDSLGGKLTLKSCNSCGRAFYTNNDNCGDMAIRIHDCGYHTINVAGNRESRNPGIEAKVYSHLLIVFDLVERLDAGEWIDTGMRK